MGLKHACRACQVYFGNKSNKIRINEMMKFLFLNNIEVDNPTKVFTDKVTTYYKKTIEANLLKAKKIIVTSKAAKEKICGTFP